MITFENVGIFHDICDSDSNHVNNKLLKTTHYLYSTTAIH